MTDKTLDDLAALALMPKFGGGYWYSSIVSKVARIPSDKIPTMGVCFNSRGLPILLYNPEFLKKLTNLEAISILIHEALHIFFRHITRFASYPNKERTNIACDMAINQHLKYLPTKEFRGIYPQDYNFPNDLTAEMYYDLLKKLGKEQESNSSSGFDDHSLWGKILNENGNLIDVEGSGIDCESEIDTIVRSIIQEMKSKGTAPDWAKKIIEELDKKPTFDWRRELRMYVNTALSPRKRLSQKRVNRRFMEEDYILPGKKKSRQANVLVVRDTSGSMWSEEVQRDLMTEVLSINSRASVWLVDCDTEVKGEPVRVKKLDDIKEFKGGGGTSFVAPFKTAKKLNVDLVIYMTDLCGDFPDKKEIGRYATNTIWCVWKQNYYHGEDVPFGRVVVVDSLKEE